MIERMSKGKLTRLKRKNCGLCRLPTCQKAFQIGDEIVRIGKHIFHANCADFAFMDYGETDSEVDSEVKT